MQFCRLYSDDDGKSHFEDLDQHQGSKSFYTRIAVKALVFKNDMNRDIFGWHNAPRRQWCITLAGVAIGLGDGTEKTFEPGDVFLAEDITGQGHTALPKNWVEPLSCLASAYQLHEIFSAWILLKATAPKITA